MMTGCGDRSSGDAALAVSVFAVDPAALGGLRLRGRAGGASGWVVERLKTLLPATAPLRKLPLSIGDDRLLGGLDLGATLKAGRPVLERGLLAESDGGVVLLPGSERMQAPLAARLVATLDAGEVAVQREGFAQRFACRVGFVAFDEGAEADEQPPAILLERLSLQVMLPDRIESTDLTAIDSERIAQARSSWRTVSMPDDVLRALCEAAMLLGVASARAPLLAVRVARIHAALNARSAATAEDAGIAARLVYALRATSVPTETSPPAEAPQKSEETETCPQEVTAPLADIVVDAARAALPADLLAALLSAAPATGSRKAETGGAGRVLESHRGRPLGSRAGDLRSGKRLHLIHTLRAAAPWQKLRRGADDGRRVHVRRDDFRITRFKHQSQSLTLFVVDASGSSALHRLAEAKGAVELLLADCYVRRDQVALLAFRGQGTELILPPTRSLPRAKRCLAGIPGGGGTPLASAIDAARLMGEQARRKGQTPLVVLLTDGRANIARDGSPGREAAEADAHCAARGLRASQLSCIMIDTSPSPHPVARRLAVDMRARYLALPRADAATLSGAVRCAIAD